jgi:hypothetical protein
MLGDTFHRCRVMMCNSLNTIPAVPHSTAIAEHQRPKIANAFRRSVTRKARTPNQAATQLRAIDPTRMKGYAGSSSCHHSARSTNTANAAATAARNADMLPSDAFQMPSGGEGSRRRREPPHRKSPTISARRPPSRSENMTFVCIERFQNVVSSLAPVDASPCGSHPADPCAFLAISNTDHASPPPSHHDPRKSRQRHLVGNERGRASTDDQRSPVNKCRPNSERRGHLAFCIAIPVGG